MPWHSLHLNVYHHNFLYILTNISVNFMFGSESCLIIHIFFPGMLKMDRQERLYHIDDTPTGVSDVFREGDKLYEVGLSS